MSVNAFEQYLVNTEKVSEKTIKHYSGAIETISKDCSVNLYDIAEMCELTKAKKIILKNEEFIRKNQVGNNMYNAALSHYEKYILNNNKYFNKLNTYTELEPDEHDGSYELVRETVKQYNYIDIQKVNFKDADLIYFMTIGTWRCSTEKKKDLIQNSNLDQPQKDYLYHLLEKIEKFQT